MFKNETRTLVRREKRRLAHATCDRCGHEMDEADHHSGFGNLTLLRFRAGADSKFGVGNYIEGDFCDACLFELVARYVRVIDADAVPDSADFFRVESPRRLYVEYQIATAMAEGVFATLKDWITRCYDPSFARHPLVQKTTASGDVHGEGRPDA